MLEASGLALGTAIFSPLVSDKETAYVVKQDPPLRDAQGRNYRIRSGQMINLWMDVQMPMQDVVDTTNVQMPD